MSARCTPGDLAVVIDAFNPENIGIVVRVIGPYRYEDDDTLPGTYFPRISGRTIWIVSAPRQMKWNDSQTSRIWYASSGPAPDEQLQPIKPTTGMVMDSRRRELEEVQP